MTRAANAVLLYLKRYLEKNPKRRAALLALYKKTTGRELSLQQLWRHTGRKVEPNLSTSLVYLVFLSLEEEFKRTKKLGVLFTYKHPEYFSK